MSILDSIPVPNHINPGVSASKQRTMLALLGRPRSMLDQECRPVTEPRIRALIETVDVGPFRVTGLRPATQSLAQVMADVRQARPDIFAALSSAGMLCCRLVRGSTSSISNHGWGTAVDLKLQGQLDRRGDDRVLQGLADIAPIFNGHGWYWGAGFRTEDAMHFEVADETIRRWHEEGKFGADAPALPPAALSLGDRGPEVRQLQEALNERGADLLVDGIFGPGTHAAVMAFQGQAGLTVDGIAGRNTLAALGL